MMYAELLNEEMTLVELDNRMESEGFYSIMNDGVIANIISDGNVVYEGKEAEEDIIITFRILSECSEKSLVEITCIELF